MTWESLEALDDKYSVKYKELLKRYNYALDNQYLGCRIYLDDNSELIDFIKIENVKDTDYFEVEFKDFKPFNSDVAVIFYPEGYLPTLHNNPDYPDNFPQNINNSIDINTKSIKISKYLPNGNMDIFYIKNDISYKINIIVNENVVVKINGFSCNISNEGDIYYKTDVCDLISNLLITKSESIPFNIRIQLDAQNDLTSTAIVTHYDSLNSKIKIRETKENDLESNFSITEHTNLESNINVSRYKDLYINLTVTYEGKSELKSTLDITKYSNLLSEIILDRNANQIKADMIVKVNDKSDITSNIIIRRNEDNLIKSSVDVRYYDNLLFNINIYKANSIPIKFDIKPFYSNNIPFSIDVISSEDIRFKMYIKTFNAVINGNVNTLFSVNKDLNLSFDIRRIELQEIPLLVTINPINSVTVYSDLIKNTHSDIPISLTIRGEEQISMNITIASLNTFKTESSLIKNIYNQIKITSKIIHQSQIPFSLFIPVTNIIQGNTDYIGSESNYLPMSLNVQLNSYKDIICSLFVRFLSSIDSSASILNLKYTQIESYLNIKEFSQLPINLSVNIKNEFDSYINTINTDNYTLLKFNANITEYSQIPLTFNISKITNLIGYIKTVDITDEIESIITIRRTDNSDLPITFNIPNINNMDSSALSFNGFDDSIKCDISVRHYSQIPLSAFILSGSKITTFMHSETLMHNTINSELISNLIITNSLDIKMSIDIPLYSTLLSTIDMIMSSFDLIDGLVNVTHYSNLPMTINVANKFDIYSMVEAVGVNDSYRKLSVLKDSYVSETKPTQNYGSNNSIIIGNTYDDGEFETFIQFDLNLVKKTDDIYKAELVLLSDSQVIINNLLTYSTDDNWQENTITWLNKPETGKLLSSINKTLGRGRTRFDITKYIKDSYNSKRLNPSIIIKQSSDSITMKDKAFVSKEGTYNDKRPYLFITYRSNITKKYDINNLSITLNVKAKDMNNLPLKLYVDCPATESNLKISFVVKNNTYLQSNIIINCPQVRFNGNIKVNETNDLISNIKVRNIDINEITSTITITKPTIRLKAGIRNTADNNLPMSLVIRQNENSDMKLLVTISHGIIKSNIIVRKTNTILIPFTMVVRKKPSQDNVFEMIISKPKLPSNVIVTYTNEIPFECFIISNDISKIPISLMVTVPQIPISLNVSQINQRKFTLFVRNINNNDIAMKLGIQYTGTSLLKSTFNIRHQDDKEAYIRITKPNCRMYTTIRRTEVYDISISLTVFRIEDYAYII